MRTQGQPWASRGTHALSSLGRQGQDTPTQPGKKIGQVQNPPHQLCQHTRLPCNAPRSGPRTGGRSNAGDTRLREGFQVRVLLAPQEQSPRPQDLAPNPGKCSGLKGAWAALPASQGQSSSSSLSCLPCSLSASWQPPLQLCSPCRSHVLCLVGQESHPHGGGCVTFKEFVLPLRYFTLWQRCGRQLKGSCVHLGFFHYKYDHVCLGKEETGDRASAQSGRADTVSPIQTAYRLGQSVFECKHVEEKPS